MMWYVTPKDSHRQRLWEYLFQTVDLPVLSNEPRLQVTRYGDTLAYDLQISKLSAGQVMRLAAHIANQTGRDYNDVHNELCAMVTYPLQSDGLRIFEDTAVSFFPPAKRPFSFLSWLRRVAWLWGRVVA